MENTPEFWKFVKECEEKYPQIGFPTIEIYWELHKNDPIKINQDEKTTPKKSKK
jgi:hypothetical protein